MTIREKTDAEGNKRTTCETCPNEGAHPGTGYGGGMSIREYMAAHIMAGFAASDMSAGLTIVAGNAVRWADALIEALNASK